jgi:hypothetical protein
VAVLKSFANAAPAAIRSDFQVFASAFSTYAAALKSSGFKAGQTPTGTQLAAIAAAAQKFGSPQLKAAETHLQAWAQKNCSGLAPTTTNG